MDNKFLPRLNNENSDMLKMILDLAVKESESEADTDTIGIWTHSRYYMDGGLHFVLANSPIVENDEYTVEGYSISKSVFQKLQKIDELYEEFLMVVMDYCPLLWQSENGDYGELDLSELSDSSLDHIIELCEELES